MFLAQGKLELTATRMRTRPEESDHSRIRRYREAVAKGAYDDCGARTR